MKIAIIGTGIAGLGAAHALSRLHDVELFEANPTPGGTSTRSRTRGFELDTGFIVHNEANYPSLTRLFRELGVADPGVGDVLLDVVRLRARVVEPTALAGGPVAARARSSASCAPPGDADVEGQDVRPLPARRGLLRLVPLALPGADDLRALVDRAG